VGQFAFLFPDLFPDWWKITLGKHKTYLAAKRCISELLIKSTQNHERWNIEQRLNWHSGSWRRYGRLPSNLFISFLFCYPDVLLPVTTAPHTVWYYV